MGGVQSNIQVTFHRSRIEIPTPLMNNYAKLKFPLDLKHHFRSVLRLINTGRLSLDAVCLFSTVTVYSDLWSVTCSLDLPQRQQSVYKCLLALALHQPMLVSIRSFYRH